MTMPLAFPRPDAVVALPPNAPPAPGAGHDGDAAASTPFGAALSVLLGHVTRPAAVDAETSTAALTDDSDSDADGTTAHATDASNGDSAEPNVVAMMHGQVAAEGVATPGAETAHAALADGSPTDSSAPTPLEAAADAVIDQTAQQSLIAALASPMTIAPLAGVVGAEPMLPVDMKTVVRDRDLLAPEFRDRLDRVIERMESEFGYKVEVAETYRSQARQDALYAQGRTDPGAVVTWTRASNHTAGRAADLVIDGSYDDTVAYERLMRTAREEGLRTLGARDPGHVELAASAPNDLRSPVIARPAPSVASQSSIVSSALELERAGKASKSLMAMPAEPPQPAPGAVAPVAVVARVAQVATVAQVAQVATIGAQATPTVVASPRGRGVDATGKGTSARRGPTAGAAARTDNPANAAASGPFKLAAGETSATSTAADDALAESGSPNDERRSRDRLDPVAARDGVAEVLRQTRDELMRAVGGSDPAATTSTTTRESASTGGIAHTDMSERIARLLKVQDAASDRPLSQVLLRLERPDGGEDRLRVDLRGSTVSATLDVSDQATADRMNANVKELQRTLERHGFDTDTLTVRTAARSVESSTLARGAGASVESDVQRGVGSSSSASTNTSSRDRGARQDGERPSPDSQRQRSRREQKGER